MQTRGIRDGHRGARAVKAKRLPHLADGKARAALQRPVVVAPRNISRIPIAAPPANQVWRRHQTRRLTLARAARVEDGLDFWLRQSAVEDFNLVQAAIEVICPVPRL